MYLKQGIFRVLTKGSTLQFLPALMQIRDISSRPPDPMPNLDAQCALILDEVGQALAEIEPQAISMGGTCTALMLADSPQALEATLLRFLPLISRSLMDNALFDELGRMSESFEARGLSEFAAQTRLRANFIRQHADWLVRCQSLFDPKRNIFKIFSRPATPA